MDFNDIYKKSLGIIKSRIEKQKYSCDAEECINEAYLQIIDNGDEVTVNNLLSRANKVADKFSIKQRFRTEFSSGRSISRICCKCKADVSVGYFGITKNNHLGVRTIQGYCKDCQKKYFEQYWNKNKEAWNLKLKGRYKKDKEGLHDRYIKKYLRNYGWDTPNITKEVIRYYRNKFIEKKENPKLKINFKFLTNAV